MSGRRGRILRANSPVGNSNRRDLGSTNCGRLAAAYAHHYQAHTWRDATNTPGIDTPAYADIDARAALFSTDDHWEVALWAKNLTDERHRINAIEARGLGIFPVYYNDPRTFGVELTRRFD